MNTETINDAMIRVEGLSFCYGKTPFIKDMSFEVKKGEIFGFLGPSGAGKSTVIKILIGMNKVYGGSAMVNGTECRKSTGSFYEEIGVDFEFSTMYDKLTAWENLMFFSSLYVTKPKSLEELMLRVGLLQEKDKRVGEFSKGMKARLNFVRALIHDPAILFLDEPTSGLDPVNSRKMKDMICEEKKKGKTILITTHNMQDAAELCDRVAFLAEGRICALDSPHNLIMSRGAAKVTYTWFDQTEHKAECLMEDLSEDRQLLSLIRQNQLTSIHSSEPTLSDLFLDITGNTLV